MKIPACHFSTPGRKPRVAGFTMMEIAICLAIIGFALVAIIGVLPIGLNTQRDNREETIINQEATVLLEAIRSGSRGADDLTNYVYAITNFQVRFISGNPQNNPPYGFAQGDPLMNTGAKIIGMLSTPEFTTYPYRIPINNNWNNDGYSNHIVAYVRSLNGLAAEKPPQNNQIMVEDSFTYRLLCVNAPMAADPSAPLTAFAKQLAANQHELRLTFLWPQLPNGNVGSGRQTFRAVVAGQLTQGSLTDFGAPYFNYFFYQPQTFTNAP
jgi:type II secretory pathway pseudopilin PulG